MDYSAYKLKNFRQKQFKNNYENDDIKNMRAHLPCINSNAESCEIVDMQYSINNSLEDYPEIKTFFRGVRVKDKKKKFRLYNFVIILILIMTSLISLDMIMGFNFLADLVDSMNGGSTLNYYFVIGGKFNDKLRAQEYSQVVYSKGGAGVVKSIENKYAVIVASYFNIDSAASVMQKNYLPFMISVKLNQNKINLDKKSYKKLVVDQINFIFDKLKSVDDLLYLTQNGKVDNKTFTEILLNLKDEINASARITNSKYNSRDLDKLLLTIYSLQDDLESLILTNEKKWPESIRRMITKTLVDITEIFPESILIKIG